MTKLKSILSWTGSVAVSAMLLVLSACALVTPTVVPPLASQMGFNVPNIKGVTTVGLIKASLRIEQAKLQMYDQMATVTLKATDEVKNGIIDIVAMLGLGGTSMLPMALKMNPRGRKPPSPPEQYNS